MKQRIWLRLCWLLLAVAMTVVCSGCGLLGTVLYQSNTDAESVILSEDPIPQDSSTSTDDTSTTTQSTEEAQPPADTPIFLRDKYEAEVEADYAADADLPEYQSTAGMCELSDKYAKRWQEIADEYYDKLMAFRYDYDDDLPEHYCDAEEFHTALADMKTAHEDFVEKEMTAYSTVLRYEYQGGTICGPIAADHRYELEKAWALRILNICDMMGIT